jgi:catechol 2,3-dioxygenase-like lactoylglutathione lyase family enzyme
VKTLPSGKSGGRKTSRLRKKISIVDLAQSPTSSWPRKSGRFCKALKHHGKEDSAMSYSIEHISIRCRDLAASVDYFRRMFDAKVILKRILDESRRIVFLHLGDSMLELMEMGPASEPMEAREHYGVHHIGIKVDDFESACRDLKSKGADFLGEPLEPTPGIRLVFLREPNGAVIELAQRDPEVFQDALAKGTVNW